MVVGNVCTLSQRMVLDLKALNGEVFYAYEPNRVLAAQGRCYKVTVGGLIDRAVTSTPSTCNANNFGADYQVGSFAFNAGSKTQFFEGEYCAARGGNRIATLTVTSSSSVSAVTASVSEKSICALEVDLTGPPFVFFPTTTTTTASATFMSPTTTPRIIATSATTSLTTAVAAPTETTTTVTLMSMRQEAATLGGAWQHNAVCDSMCQFWIALVVVTGGLILFVCCTIHRRAASNRKRVAPVLSTEVQ